MSIQINGKMYDVPGVSGISGTGNVVINGGTITVNGQTIVGDLEGEVIIKWEGPAANIKCTTLTLDGDVEGDVKATNVTIDGDVGGDVKGTNITIDGDIGGDADGINVTVNGDTNKGN